MLTGYDNWKTTPPAHEEDFFDCPACEGNGCEHCGNSGTLCEHDCDSVVAYLEEEAEELRSLEANYVPELDDLVSVRGTVEPDPRDWEGNVYGPNGAPAMTSNEIDEMVAWHRAFSDLFSNDLKGRC